MHPAHCLNIRSSTAGSSWYVEVLKGTLFSEDRHWLETQSRGLVTCKTVRREKVHCGRTTLNVKCTSYNCTMLNDMIQLSHKLIAENKKDSKKEIVFQRLREAGRTSITEGDASAHLEPPVGTAWTTMPPSPPPAGAAAAACAIAPLRRARSSSSSSCAEADGSATAAALPLQLIQLQKNVSRGFLTELSSCRSSRSSTQSRPAPHEADGPATTATPPAPHEADGSATAAAPPRGRHEEEEKEAKKKIPRPLIMHDTTANAPSPRAPGMYDGGVYCAVQPESIQEKKREQRWEEQFKLLKQEYIFKDPGASESATNAEQSRGRERSKERLLFSSREGSRRGRGRGKKRELSTPIRSR